jgi:hypothetical protein
MEMKILWKFSRGFKKLSGQKLECGPNARPSRRLSFSSHFQPHNSPCIPKKSMRRRSPSPASHSLVAAGAALDPNLPAESLAYAASRRLQSQIFGNPSYRPACRRRGRWGLGSRGYTRLQPGLAVGSPAMGDAARPRHLERQGLATPLRGRRRARAPSHRRPLLRWHLRGVARRTWP